MLQELGPCLITSHGKRTVYNKYGPSALTNLLIVDQPAGVGFSYVDAEPNSEPEVAGSRHATDRQCSVPQLREPTVESVVVVLPVF